MIDKIKCLYGSQCLVSVLVIGIIMLLTAPSWAQEATETPFTPTETPTETPFTPTETPTETPFTPTETPTETPFTPTDTPTETPFTPTETPFTPTNTPVPPPTDTPTETPFTPTNTPAPPTNTPTMPPVSTATATAAEPTSTPGPTNTPGVPQIGLIAVDGFMGLHTAGTVTVNFDHYAQTTWPIHMVRDANLTGDGRGVFVVDLFGHVSTFSLGSSTLDQIPDARQWYFVPQDLVVAVRSADDTAYSAHILLDNGQILPVGNASNLPDLRPPLPFRDGTEQNPAGDPVNREMAIPGPLEGPLNIGTIAQTGGWNVNSAIDFDVTAPDGALVLLRSGQVIPTGSALFQHYDITPYFGVDIARRIEYFTEGGKNYYVVLDGLGGVHLAGPAQSELRTNWNNKVLTELAYFGAVIGQNENGGDIYVGLDAANDFVPVLTTPNDIGVIMLDGLGGLHFANLGSDYTSARTAYFGANPMANLDWLVSLILVQ